MSTPVYVGFVHRKTPVGAASGSHPIVPLMANKAISSSPRDRGGICFQQSTGPRLILAAGIIVIGGLIVSQRQKERKRAASRVGVISGIVTES